MSLTTIDGQLYLPRTEYAYLYSVSELMTRSEIRESQRLLAEDQLKRSAGVGSRTYQSVDGDTTGVGSSTPWNYLPDAAVGEYILKCIRPRGYGRVYAQVGEEDINGDVWPGPDEACANLSDFLQYWTDENGQKHYNGRADLSPTGPASLGGKIVIELCRRLGWEICLDELAQRYAAPSRLIPRVLQPPETAENK